MYSIQFRDTLLVTALLATTAAFGNGAAPELPAFSRYTAPVFPARLAAESVKEGSADVAFTVDEKGHITDAVILAESHPLFGAALLDAMRSWELETAESATLPRREVLHGSFRRQGSLVSMSHLDAARALFPASAGESATLATLAWEQLAAPPEKLVEARPDYPEVLRRQGVGGRAAVNFVIDSDGRVRVPVVVAADRPEFGAAALGAVRAWRFAPPRHNGAPVQVEATRVFSFGRRAEGARQP